MMTFNLPVNLSSLIYPLISNRLIKSIAALVSLNEILYKLHLML